MPAADGSVLKRIINRPEDFVRQALSGLTAAHSSIVDSDLESMVCFRRVPLPAGTVACVSGGGSGHEPMHAGFVGEGMLAAAALGEVFASPSSDQILAAMKAAEAGGGVLLVVKNYTGDVLNFRLAAELAGDEGIEHSMVVVAEDAALPADGPGPGRRGTAATVLVEKIAGAAASRGAGLKEVSAIAQRVADSSRSIGFALRSCTAPMVGRPTFELGEAEIEFGIGIHGERGRRTQLAKSSSEQAEELVETLAAELGAPQGTAVLAFTNGLGATPVSEQLILHNDVVAALERRGLRPVRHLVGSYATSLDMEGASLSLLPLDEELTDLWDAPVRTPALTW